MGMNNHSLHHDRGVLPGWIDGQGRLGRVDLLDRREWKKEGIGPQGKALSFEVVCAIISASDLRFTAAGPDDGPGPGKRGRTVIEAARISV
jgi:hypothetical protein